MWLKMRNFCNVCMIASDFWCIFKNIFSGLETSFAVLSDLIAII